MATLADVLAEVYAITNRSDLVTQTTSIVKAATLKAHGSDYFPADIVRGQAVFATLAKNQAWAWLGDIPRARALSSIFKQDYLDTSLYLADVAKRIDLIVPDNNLDDYKALKQNTAYLAGTTWIIRSSDDVRQILYEAYSWPLVTDVGYSSWIADRNMYPIVYEAARVVFKTIGYDEEASVYDALVKQQYQELKMWGLTGQGW